MLNQNEANNKYKQAQFNTANRGKLVVMLYEGCIKYLKMTNISINDGKIETANKYSVKSQDIINELMVNLDREKGGDIADNLFSLYEFMNNLLVEANVNKDTKTVEIVINMLEKLLVSWKEIVNNTSNKDVKVSISI